MEKNKILSFQRLKNVTLAKEVVLNQVTMQDHVQCVEVMDKLDQVKDFLPSNKHVLNVQDRVKKLQIHAIIVMDKVNNKLLKDSQFQFQKVWTMEQE